MDMPTITDEAFGLRRIAEAGPIGKRHSSFELYDLLGGCMRLAERCRDRTAFEEIRNLVLARPAVGRRAPYIERGSDEFILVCRFVFANLRSASAERSNASRYAHALRHAHSLGIGGGQIAAHLRENGGINALFLRRPLAARNVTTKCLTLTQSVTIEKGSVVRLTLRRLPDNTYEVLRLDRIEDAVAA